MSWSKAALGDVFEIARGGSPRPIEKFLTDDPDGLNWVSISDATRSGKVIERTERRIKPEGLAKSRWVEPGDFLLSNSMSFGRPYIMGTTGCIHDGWLVLKPGKTAVDPDYLYHLLGSEPVFAQFAKRATGTTVKNLNTQIVSETEIPLPPLPEQRRIAAILDQADELRRLRRQSLSRLSDLGQTIFVSQFGPGGIFPFRKIGEFADVKGGKRLPKGAEYSSLPTAHPYIRVSNLSDGLIETEGMKFITEDIHKTVARYIVRANDVVISIAGTIGVVAPVRENLDGANLTENAAKITPKAEGAFDADYLTWALQTPQLRQSIRASTGQVTIGKLALFRIEDLSVPMPDIDVQREFARQMKSLETKRERFAGALAQSESLFASLQHRAFRGEL